jgi:hypothetical protein
MVKGWFVALVVIVIVGFIVWEENPYGILGSLKTGGS